jgi:Domain of unknown function DUF29
MTATQVEALRNLYEQDETAWLDRMAELIQQRRLGELDYASLGEYLADMARRDRREVKSRLMVLLAHLLKWEHQPSRRSGSWAATIHLQQEEFADLASSGVLRNHAEAILGEAYDKAVKQAAVETELTASSFPAECPYSVEDLIRLDQLPE